MSLPAPDQNAAQSFIPRKAWGTGWYALRQLVSSLYRIRKTEFGACDEYMIINHATKESATITSLGANVRSLDLVASAQGRPMPVVLGYDTPAELREGSWSRGIKMIPFPNRILDGRYEFGGRQYELPINFPSQHHAIHGLLSRQVLSCRDMGYSHEPSFFPLHQSLLGEAGLS